MLKSCSPTVHAMLIDAMTVLAAPTLAIGCLLTAAACPTSAPAQSAPQAPTPPPEPARVTENATANTVVENEVRTLLTRQAADWSAGRLEAFCAVYADDAVFISPKGITRGRAEILARYDKRYRQEGKEMGRLTLTVLDIDAHNESAAVAMKWHLDFPSRHDVPPPGTDPAPETGPRSAEGHSLVTLRRRADTSTFEIIHDASM